MKKKLVGIVICLMMLATILPVTAMATQSAKEPQTEPAGLFDRTTIRGFVLFKRTADGGSSIQFFALRLHYTTLSLTGERESGVIQFQPIKIPNTLSGFYGKFYIIASFRGSLDI